MDEILVNITSSLLGAVSIQGVNPKVVQERLGHSTILLTLDIYNHVLLNIQGAAVDALTKAKTTPNIIRLTDKLETD